MIEIDHHWELPKLICATVFARKEELPVVYQWFGQSVNISKSVVQSQFFKVSCSKSIQSQYFKVNIFKSIFQRVCWCIKSSCEL